MENDEEVKTGTMLTADNRRDTAPVFCIQPFEGTTMIKVVNLKNYQIRKKRDRIKQIRDTILMVTGRHLTDEQIYDIYGAAVFVAELSKGEHDEKKRST